MKPTMEEIEQELEYDLDGKIGLVNVAKADLVLARKDVKAAEKKLKAYRKAVAKAKALAAPEEDADEESPMDEVAEALDRR